jgi:ketosteroid isomerase-like protein
MSQENVERYRRAIDAFNRRDLDAFLSMCDPDVEFFSRFLELEGGGPYRGHEGLRSWWEELFDVSPDFRGDIEEIRDLGDDVVIARVRFHGHGAESNAPMDQTSWQIVRGRDKKAIWMGIYRSEAEALEAAGLSE